jgi:ribonuclease P protein component
VTPELGGAKRARYGLDADRRLARKADFERLLKDGTRRSRSGYTMFVATRAGGPPRLGILISRKHAAKATVRNRIKRCIREAFRLEQPGSGRAGCPGAAAVRAQAGVAMLQQLRGLFSELGK